MFRVGLALLFLVFSATEWLVDAEYFAVCNRLDITGPWYRQEGRSLCLSLVCLLGMALCVASFENSELAVSLASVFALCVLEINFNKLDYIDRAGHHASVPHTITAAMLVVSLLTMCVAPLVARTALARLGQASVFLASIVLVLRQYAKHGNAWRQVNWAVAICLLSAAVGKK